MLQEKLDLGALIGGNLAELAMKIVSALLILIIGLWLVKKIVILVKKGRKFQKLAPEVQTFLASAVKVVGYAVVIMMAVTAVGVPTASILAVLGSCGLAVGLALQGSLSNLAGGIMMVIFKPFKVGDFVEAAGVSGVVKEITLFYTVLNTPDNCRIHVPNGSLMNANIIDYSAEDTRRVDLTFACAKSESPAAIQKLILEAMCTNEKVLADPAPFARLSGGTNEAMQFTARAWCKSADYWDVYFDLTQAVTEKLGENGVQAPAVRVISGS